MWQQAKRDENITNVWVEKVKSDNAYLEISKYVAKDFEYLAHEEILMFFINQLKVNNLLLIIKFSKN